MADIAIDSRFATAGAFWDILHIARSVLHQIGEDHRIVGYTQEASTSHEPLIRPTVSSTPSRMQPIQGGGREEELIIEVVLEMLGQVMVQTVRAV